MPSLEREWDCLIIGAGPAGASAAVAVARAGVRALLVDRAVFPRWKVCGCCLNASAIAYLRQVGLGPFLSEQRAVPLRELSLFAGKLRSRLVLPEGLAISRERLDMAMIQQAVQEGVTFLPATTATAISMDEECHHAQLIRKDETITIRARIVLSAEGLNGRYFDKASALRARSNRASRIGAGTIVERPPGWFQPGIVHMACGRGGYVGAVRLEDGRLDLAAALCPKQVRAMGDIDSVVNEIMHECQWPVTSLGAHQGWRGAPALTRQASSVAGHRSFLLGDAAGYIEPFTGEGIAWALASGNAVAPLVVEALREWRPDLIREWQRRHRQLLGHRQRMCGWIAWALRSPRLTRMIIRALGWFPSLASPILQGINRKAVSES